MEAAAAVGLVASLATLVGAAKVVVGIAHEIPQGLEGVSRFKEAASQIYHQAQLIQQLLVDIQSIESTLSKRDKEIVLENVRQAEHRLQKVATRVEKLLDRSEWKLRWKWVLTNRSQAQDIMTNLGCIETTLTLTLTVLNAYTREYDRLILKKMEEDLSLLVTRSARPPALSSLSKMSDTAIPPISRDFQEGSANTDCFELWRYSSEEKISSCWWLGVLTRRRQRRQTTYALAAQVNLPWSRVVMLNLIWRTYFSDWLSVSILRGSCLSVMRFAPEDCDFMEACQKGDFVTMRSLLDKGEGSPNDVTTGNYTPMCLAIESGSLDAVKTLISYGADVDAVFGQNQTSPLAWAIHYRRQEIARLLLSYGASCDHVSSLGWTPLFYIWSLASETVGPCIELIQLLAAARDFSLSHIGVSDKAGFSVIHRAVIFGTADEVDILLRIGVSPFITVGPLHWTAIQNAVYYGKPEIFEILLPYYEHIPIDCSDLRGWTLLHISASAGQSALTRRLLELGADPQAKSKPSYTHMPEHLYGGSWTPAEVAKAESEERWVDLLRAIREVVGDSVLSCEEMEALKEDEWFDTCEV